MHDRLSIDALCFPGADLAELAANWRELEPRRISVMSSLLTDDLSVPQRILAEGGYELESMTHLFLWGRQLDAGEEFWDEERAKLSRAIDAAAALGCPSIYMLTGGHGRLTWEEAAERFSAGIVGCRERAEGAGVALAVEPASPLYADAHLAHTLRDTVLLAELAGIGVVIDIYACWAESGLKETIERAVPRCTLVQVADYVYGDRSLPSRAVPGDGAIPLERIFGWILAAGYDGAFDLELIGPRIDAEGHVEATRRAAKKVGEILVGLGA